ncbi:MAG: urea ABC transporter substrate-binding protein [Bryobacterales bacterium]|nr:urea ABC transporter substrate-binding protein [Bryobacterales bacterium]
MNPLRFAALRFCAAVALMISIACSGSGPAPSEQEAATIPVGVLHSLTGTMAISEIPVRDATLLAIEQINAAGGVLGKPLTPVVEDGASEPATFAQKAQKLIQQDRVATVFGGWTSASRKAMLPVFEANSALLWYPVQFEGNECSPNIFYLGAQPNQQILPALDWAFREGKKKIYLLGSDYVFPRTANLILKKHIEDRGGEVAGEDYVPLGGTDFSSVINKIKAAGPQVIFNTLNGDSNVAFFKQLQAEGLTAEKLPVMSFSIAEQEAKAMGPALVEGHYAAWNYFQSLPGAPNAEFVAAYRKAYGADQVVDDPMEAGYVAVYLWKAAVEKAGTLEPEAVRKAAWGLAMDAPEGPVKIDDNQSLYKAARVGKLLPDGQFEVIWATDAPVEPVPYDPLAFPGKTCGWGGAGS